MMPHLHLLLACLAASPAVLADLQPIRRQSWPAGPSEQQQPQSSQQPSKDPNTSDSAPKSLSLGLKHANMPNSLDGLRQMVEHGRDRFRGLFPNGHDGSALGDGGQGLKERQDEDDGSGNPQEPATNLQITFLAELGVGAGTYDLIVDTGSSNTWVGAQRDNPYQPSNASTLTGNAVTVTYGTGSFAGQEVQDTVNFNEFSLDQQGIGAAVQSRGFSNLADGILGLGPAALTQGTLYPNSQDTIPTVVDTAVQQGVIDQPVLGVFFRPTSGPDPEEVGQLTFGGPDSSRLTSDLMVVPKSARDNVARFFGIEISATQDDQEILTDSAGIVDTGTTLIYLPQAAFEAYTQNVGGTLDDQTGMVKIPAENIDQIPDLNFLTANNITLTLNNYAQLVPTPLYERFQLEQGSLYSWVVGMAGDGNGGPEFIIGQKFLERYYSVYSLVDEGSISFAETEFTFPDSLDLP